MEAEEKMAHAEEHVMQEFSGVRTGKASPALVENVQVDAYGSQMRLKEMASITTPEPRTLFIQPWDVSTIGPIEKGILKANLGLNPASDGRVLRLVLPELSTERRQELVKLTKKMAEDGRISVRHARRDAMESVKAESKAGDIPEDDANHAEKDIQKLTDKYVANIDGHLQAKEQEIMTV